MTVEVRSLTPELRPDFYRLHSEENDCEWCCCAAWWVPTWAEFSQNTGERNRQMRDELFAKGECDGYLAYLNGQPIGWCQVGPRDRLQKLVQQYQLSPDPHTWAITCFLVAPPHRHQGVARKILAGVLDDLRRRGIRRLEAYPRRGAGSDDGEVWTGPEALFAGAGFTVSREHPERPVLELRL